MNSRLSRAAGPALAVATALTLAACGSSTTAPSGSGVTPGNGGMPGMSSAAPGMSSTAPGMSSAAPGATSAPAGPAASGPHNQADVDFATGMIPHHGQAVTMAELALTKATNPTVKQLATEIKAAQDPEIKTMSGFLQGWGQPVPATAGGHDMGAVGSTAGSSNMAGMMTDQQMSQLGSASGAGFDRMWVQMMLEHHRGAVAESKTELSTGSSSEAKQLAQTIIDGQTKEITTMTALLATLPS